MAALALQKEIQSYGVEAMIVSGDLSSREPLQLVQQVTHSLGPVSILVNNASHFSPNTTDSADIDAWQRDLTIHVTQPALLCGEFARLLGKDEDGRIINLLDWRAQLPDGNYLTYNVAKSGLWSLTRNLAFQLGPRITVNAVAPGPILPPEGGSHDSVDAGALPLARWGNPEAVVKAALFLLEDADYTTGAVIPVDGGRHLGEITAGHHPEA